MDSKSKLFLPLFPVGTLVCILDNKDSETGYENTDGIQPGDILPIEQVYEYPGGYAYRVNSKAGSVWWLGPNQIALPESLSKLDRSYYGIQEEG